jgi:hypothetical protein
MRVENKVLRLKTSVTIGWRFGEWRVYWLGGWTAENARRNCRSLVCAD